MASGSTQCSVLLAGGGSGGHIFPNLAILERLRERRPDVGAVFVVSQRPLDAQILEKHQQRYTPIPVQPLTAKPWRWPAFYQAWRQSVDMTAALMRQMNVRAVAATGGFVSGPAISAAHRLGLPVALVNLDAIPGKANAWMAGRATAVFSVYATPTLAKAQRIGMPLRKVAIGPADRFKARAAMGLDPERETIFVTGASQGASSLNRMMIELVGQTQVRKALRAREEWQVLHLTGDKGEEAEAARKAYEKAGVPARVLPFCDTMGQAWCSASIAISRAGAGSVAEAWVNAVPTIFFPYPYHKDLHQKHNAEPLTQAGAAVLMLDQIDPATNARQLGPRLLSLMSNSTQRYQMAENLRNTRPPDGAAIVADWLSAACKG
ncbi:MAG: UDP-N-acetylglucosamine--N-acetylmuramyl-(pentapeptide) pyrophosphoryl-undecaprenol N-acetylglucosamine transferase [Phycisphaeraceae bacterium]